MVVLTVGFIWGNSCFSQQDSAEQSSGVLELLRKIFTAIGAENTGLFLFIEQYVRKIAHFSEYFLLGTEAALLFLHDGFRFSFQRLWNAFSFSLAVAVADETIQMFTGRGPAVKDVLIDSSGASCGIFIVFLFGCLFLSIRKKSKTDNKKISAE